MSKKAAKKADPKSVALVEQNLEVVARIEVSGDLESSIDVNPDALDVVRDAIRGWGKLKALAPKAAPLSLTFTVVSQKGERKTVDYGTLRAAYEIRAEATDEAPFDLVASLAGIEVVTCEKGSYKARLLPTADKAIRVVRAWSERIFDGARFMVRRTTGAQAVSLNEVRALYGLDRSDRHGGDDKEAAPVVSAALAVVAMVRAEGGAVTLASDPAVSAKASKKAKAKVAAASPEALPEATTGKKLTIVVLDEDPKVTEARAAKAAATAIEAARARTPLYTIGYGGGLTPADVFAACAERNVPVLIDTREKDGAGGWKMSKLATMARAAGLDYWTVRGADGVRDAFKRLSAQGRGGMFVRREEAPGNDALHLALCTLAKVTHLFRDEEVDGVDLVKAIEADAKDPTVDHAYEALVDDVAPVAPERAVA